MTGSKLGQYQLLEKIGSGGMGDVYKARDTRLNRVVAVKVLPPNKVANEDRKRRFIQEAQADSALQHPNIVVIHDINEENGVDYMAMEYIAGKTLDERIPRQGMRLGEALKIAIPIADGLAKAHTAGIIHRDVKPANIMISDDGIVKILDFGLAKLTENTSGIEADATRAASPRTEDGAILGTVQYMSPEQAESKKLDARSDIFSFGVMLYEMLSGQRPFQGESMAATLSAILKEEPKPIADLPAEVDRILRRCLRKDPARRFQSMADLKVELEDMREQSDSGSLASPRPVAAPTRRSIVPLAIGVAGVAALAIAGWMIVRNKPAPELRLRQITADIGVTATPSISADGRLVAYSSDRAEGNRDIWVHPLSEGARPIRLTKDPAQDIQPDFSPDGGQVVFRSNRGEGGIYIVPALGGEERLLVRGGYYPKFSPDGQWVAYTTSGSQLMESKIFIVPVAGGTPQQVGADIPNTFRPNWTADGKHLLVAGTDGVGNTASGDLWIVDVAGQKSKRLGFATSLREAKLPYPQFLIVRGNQILFGAASTIWEVDLALDPVKLGKPRKVAAVTGDLLGLSAATGKIVVGTGVYSSHLYRLPMDFNTGKVTGELQPLPHSGGRQSHPACSADCRMLVYTQQNPQGDELRIRDMAKGVDTVLLTKGARAKISPDGKKVAYGELGVGRGLWLMDSTGGASQQIVQFERSGQIYGWGPEPNTLIYYRSAPIRFFSFDLRTKQEKALISHPTMDVHSAEPSPDFKWVLFTLPGERNAPIKIAPLRDGLAAPEAEWITVGEYPGHQSRPWWSPDGNLIYFQSVKDQYPDVWAQKLDPATKRPVGDAFAVMHFHDMRKIPDMGGAPFGPGIGANELIFALMDVSANIWVAETQ